mmetsp:Transcript_20316/g.30169  ORF Transcript_20316/g.30169 Transcript_20316/m.30169 type:complete len:84 (+) Transcript_20316:1031-1282(+)
MVRYKRKNLDDEASLYMYLCASLWSCSPCFGSGRRRSQEGANNETFSSRNSETQNGSRCSEGKRKGVACLENRPCVKKKAAKF